MTTPTTPAEVTALLATDPHNNVLAAAKGRTNRLLGTAAANRVWMQGRIDHLGWDTDPEAVLAVMARPQGSAA